MGAIIVIEGIEGSGKETQSKLLVNYLEKHNYKVVGMIVLLVVSLMSVY